MNIEHSSSGQVVAQANKYEQPLREATLFVYEKEVKRNEGLSGATAIIDVFRGREISYGELLLDSDLLSKYILGKSSHKTKGLIGILSEKGYSQVISALSIMKTGNGYLPLHIDWPLGRLDSVLEQGGVKLLLLSEEQYKKDDVKKLSDKYELLVIEETLRELRANKVLKEDISKQELPEVKSEEVACVIFTSGSTGVPKGVTINHRGALNTIDAVNNRFNIGRGDKVLALSELNFDLSVYDLFGILSAGGTIVYPNQAQTKDPGHWLDLISRHEISIWNTTPQLADLLMDEAEQEETFLSSLRLFLLSGDWIPTNLPSRIKACCAGSTVMSLGGATEGSIWSIWYEIKEVPKTWNSIPYGEAMPNQKMYVLNADTDHCPLGVIGEIHIGGEGVALNYWGDKKKTAFSFVEHKELGRLYKTGDLGRWHKDGYMEFIGRKDSQLKIRGYRVELGEIEHTLTNCAGIKQSIVMASEGNTLGTKYLMGYYVSDEEQEERKLVEQLSKKLPDYMIPSVFIHLETLPLTINGKIDLKALPRSGFSMQSTYVAPRDDLEKEVCAIWAEVLRLDSDKVGIRDNFLSLGGDSIISIQLTNKLRQQLGATVGIQDIFSCKNIETLCAEVLSKRYRQGAGY